jgi:hypothetical protein
MWAQKLFLVVNTNKQYFYRVIYSLKGQCHDLDILLKI